MHGKQQLHPSLQSEPTSYYTRNSGIGRLIEAMHPRKGSIKVGVIGLGTGTLATYGAKGISTASTTSIRAWSASRSAISRF
jgi:hypothetical protein